MNQFSLLNYDKTDIVLLTKNAVHNAAKGVPNNLAIHRKKTSVKILTCTNDFLKLRTRRTRLSIAALYESMIRTLKCITMDQIKTMMTCMDNKRWICNNNIHTLAFGYHTLSSLNAKKISKFLYIH